MPWTLTTLQQAIQDWSENQETTFVANLPNIIRMAELRIAEQVQMDITGVAAQGVFTQGTFGYPLPADFLSPYSLRCFDRAGKVFFLLQKEEQFRRQAYPDPNYQAKPKYYSIIGTAPPTLIGPQFALSPTPDWSYAYTLNYFGRPASIVDTVTTYIGTNAEDVLFFGCMKNAAIFMKEEADVISLYDTMFQESVSNFKVTGQGRARKDWFRRPDKRIDPSIPQAPATQAGG